MSFEQCPKCSINLMIRLPGPTKEDPLGLDLQFYCTPCNYTRNENYEVYEARMAGIPIKQWIQAKKEMERKRKL